MELLSTILHCIDKCQFAIIKANFIMKLLENVLIFLFSISDISQRTSRILTISQEAVYRNSSTHPHPHNHPPNSIDVNKWRKLPGVSLPLNQEINRKNNRINNWLKLLLENWELTEIILGLIKLSEIYFETMQNWFKLFLKELETS